MTAKDSSPENVDRLTGVLTRTAIVEAGEAAIAATAEGELVALGYIGLDGFALLQEAYGSVVTDQMRRETASRIVESVRPQDVVGRVDRDEFLVVFRALTSKFETLALASKIRTRVAEPMRAGTAEEELAPSCGIAQYPANGKTVAELLAYAADNMRTLQVALRSASVAAAQQAVNRARRNVEVAQAELVQAEEAYEEVVAVAAAAAKAAEAGPAIAESAAPPATPKA